MTKAYNEIEKLAKGLSDEPEVYKVLRQYNEDIKGRPSPVNPTGKDLEEATSHTVRYTDPLNKKRFAVPFKTHADAEKKMAQLKKDGVKDIKITMDTLKPGINFKEDYIMEKTYDEKDIDKFHTALDKIVHKHFGHSSDEKKEKEKKEETQLDEFTSKMIKDLQKSYADLKGKTISPEKATALSKHLDKLDVDSLRQLVKANIPFVSTVAKNKVYKKTGKFEELEEAEDYGLKGKITDNQLKNIKDTWAKKTKMDITPGVRDMIKRMDIPTKLAIQQAKINILSDLVKEDTEKEMFLQPRTVGPKGLGLAHPNHPNNKKPGFLKKLMTKLKQKNEKKEVKELKFKDIRNMERQGKSAADIAKALKVSTKSVRDILGEEKRLYVEAIAALQKKADKSGMPYSILKQVYDRGMAAWKGGHRPGAGQHQWAFARVNSFVTKSSGTWGGADKDLAAKVKGSK